MVNLIELDNIYVNYDNKKLKSTHVYTGAQSNLHHHVLKYLLRIHFKAQFIKYFSITGSIFRVTFYYH